MIKVWWVAVPSLLARVALGGSCIISGSPARAPAETVASASVDVLVNTASVVEDAVAVFDARDVYTWISEARNLDCTIPRGLMIILH